MDPTRPSDVDTNVRVFISSTWRDLQPERGAVREALSRLDETRFVGMEYFGSGEETTREVSLARLAECRLYIGIIGGRYGSGITAEEYRRAGELGIPRYVYRMREPSWVETDPAQRASLDAFIEQLETTHSLFTTPDNLAARVTADLHRWLVETIYKPQIERAGFAADLAESYLSPEPVYERLNLDRFAGRQWLKAAVDAFLESRDRGYFILEADAGLGKTAFLAHLVTERRWIHHFVELARGLEGVRNGMKSLAAQIVFRWRPELESAPADVSRPDYLDRLLSAAAATRDRTAAGEKIVIVVDGLDESAAYSGQNVMGLPRMLPAGVYVIVSKRPVPVVLDIDAPSLAVRLERTAPANEDDVREFLEAVARDGPIAALLSDSGVAAADFVETLRERSEGVWIYLHYVLEELYGGARRPLDLAALPKGLWPYYARYWRSRRNDPDWLETQLPLLGALSAAQEDASAALLCALAGIAASQRVRRLLEDWRPFLAISEAGEERRYRCYHASFRDFLQGHIGDGELTESRDLAAELAAATRATHMRIADRAIESWGGFESGLADLRDPSRRDLDEGYALRHVVTHLLSAGRLHDLSRLVQAEFTAGGQTTNAWHAAHEAIRDLDGYLSDVTRVWDAATAASEAAIARGEPAVTMILEARCALSISSVRGLAGRIGPHLLAALVEKGVWDQKHAFTYASETVLANDRLRAMTHLLPLLSEPFYEKAYQDAAVMARWSDAEALADLPSGLPRHLLQRILWAVLAKSFERSESLAGLVPKLPPDLIGEVVSFLRSTSVEEDWVDWFEPIVALLPRVDAEERDALVLLARKAAWRKRSAPFRLKALLRMAPFLPADEARHFVEEAIRKTRYRRHAKDEALLLAIAVPHLEGRERQTIARAAFDTVRQAMTHEIEDVLPVLIPHLPPALLRKAEKEYLSWSWGWDHRLAFFLPRWKDDHAKLESVLAEVEKGEVRDKGFAALVPFLPDRLLPRAFAAAVRTNPAPLALDALAPRLSTAQLELALAALVAGGVDASIGPKKDTLLDVIRRRGAGLPATPADRELLAAEALELARSNHRHPHTQVELLFAEGFLTEEPARSEHFERAVALIRKGALNRWVSSVAREILTAVAPALPEPLLRDVLGWMATRHDDDDMVAILERILPSLSETPAVESGLFDAHRWQEVSRGDRDPMWFEAAIEWLLEKLGLDVSRSTPRQRMLQALGIRDPLARAQALETRLRDLHRVLPEQFRQHDEVAALLAQIERMPPGEARQALVDRAVQIAERIETHPWRDWVLGLLVPHLPAERATRVVHYWGHHFGGTQVMIERWGRVFSPFPEDLARALLGRDGWTPFDRSADKFIAVAPHLPDALLNGALEEALLFDKEKRPALLAALAARFLSLPAHRLYGLWRTALEDLAGDSSSRSAIHALLPIAEHLGGRYDY